MDTVETGVLISYNTIKEYGFIQANGESVFFHRANCIHSCINEIVGRIVEFKRRKSPMKPECEEAYDVNLSNTDVLSENINRFTSSVNENKYNGYIDSFDFNKYYGFIQNDEERLFFHGTDFLDREVASNLNLNDFTYHVEFNVIDDIGHPGQIKAHGIRIITTVSKHSENDTPLQSTMVNAGTNMLTAVSNENSASNTERVDGRIAFYDTIKRYGFIKSSDIEIFFHVSSLVGADNYLPLNINEYDYDVQYNCETDGLHSGKLRAVNIYILSARKRSEYEIGDIVHVDQINGYGFIKDNKSSDLFFLLSQLESQNKYSPLDCKKYAYRVMFKTRASTSDKHRDKKEAYSIKITERIGLSDYMAFDEDTIRVLFGHEAAEDDDIHSLYKSYYKSTVFQQMQSSIPLYILVSHKGVGKSALFSVLAYEDETKDEIAIVVQPDDIKDLELDTPDFLAKLRIWKNGLSEIITKKLWDTISSEIPNTKNPTFNKWKNKVVNLLAAYFGKKTEDLLENKISFSSTQFTNFFKDTLFEEKRITIYIDDLDRGWENNLSNIKNLSAMLNAVRDLSREIRTLRFRVALRSDVYYSVRQSDETTDKIDGSVLWLKWTNKEILIMLIKRIESYFGRSVNEDELLEQPQVALQSYLQTVFEPRFQGSGHWQNAPMYRVIMSLIRKRPRDMVKLCTSAAREAFSHNHNKILTSDLEAIFSLYSQDRLQDTITEYKSELPDIKDLLLKMKPVKREFERGRPSIFTRAELYEKFKNIISMSSFSFRNGTKPTADNLGAFLYKINFLTARKGKKGYGIQRLYYEEQQYIYNDFTDYGYEFEIHPAYRWALQPDRNRSIFDVVELVE
jgi:cold shock CspA family protein